MSRFRFQRTTIQVEEAQRAILEHIRLQRTEWVDLEDSFGRRLAAPVAADHPVPHFRRSGVDGYAVRCADTAAASPERPAVLEVVECVTSGTLPLRRVGPGQAARIMTGAVVPEGADAVVMLEMTAPAEREGAVCIRRRMADGDNITAIGQETPCGDILLMPGRIIEAGEAAILAAFGYARVPVYCKPRVAICSTGSELLAVGSPLEPGKIRNSNGYMLAAQVRAAGGEPVIMPALPDEPELVEKELLALMDRFDCVVTSGGVSVGDKDVMASVFERWEGRLLFNKVAMRPGSPTSAGVWQGKLLFALSGNPGACFVGFELFARPFLRGLLGHPSPLPKEAKASLVADYSKGSAYPRYVRGKLETTDDGKLQAKPAGADKSSIMVSIKDAECLILIPAGGRGAAAGQLVCVLLLQETK
ncbi:Molybdopterin molybdenumtransferase [Paenibacillus konkukensis]|uniref:Molybdopterin molybdenumtransferase n=1 Tax=Paenibacillus konkukensis TaxID=2020716 RepID=A0ABY4RP66_9BACL|nr:gephyrin-like molybdotransferase Glp [Paenibacillus konkukensis]UQZ83621.1 Molybdopterin molybdenumtransferase [Paenibacillus konkukensis]